MRHLFLLLSIFIFSCCQQRLASDVEKEDLVGRVKSVSTTQYHIKTISGKILKADIFEEGITEDGDYFPVTDKIWFDKSGNKIKEDYLDSKGEVLMSWSFKYDKNQLIKTERFDSYYSILAYYTYTYKKNKLVEKIWYSSDSVQMQRKIYKYNLWDNLITEETYMVQDNAPKSSTITQIDKRGKVLEIQYKQSENNYLGKIKFIYDERKNLIEKRYYNQDSVYKKVSFKYKFDASNNWTVRYKSVNNTPLSLTERTIEYYN